MRGWTFPVGRVFGVEVRIHFFFLLVLMLCVSYASVKEVALSRGVGLGCILLLAVVMRELARGLAGAWHGLQPVTLLLVPTGGMVVYAPQDDEAAGTALRLGANDDESLRRAAEAEAREAREANVQRAVALAGPVASLLFGGAFAALILTVSPGVNLWQVPWVSPLYLLRSLVWVNVLLGVVNLLPAWPLDGAKIFYLAPGKAGKRVLPTAVGIGPVIAVALMIVGMIGPNMWLLMIGIFVLLAAQFDGPGEASIAANNVLTMRDVMMEDYTVLSASATLEDAMHHATRSLQDVFPVVRGGNLVGAVSRQAIAEALAAGGNSYVQGIMTRSFKTAKPGDPLMATLRGIMAGAGLRGAQLVPVVEGEDGERIVGIITPQNLQRSMVLLDQSRRIRMENAATKEQDEL